jgi:RNA polymerase sigma factor (sigma-70 family)
LAESSNRRLLYAEQLDRAVMTAYCSILHAASADHGSDRQRRAFEELWAWIYPRVRRRIDIAQDAEDVAQGVMLKVFQNLHQVREPRGFLAWVNVITFHEVAEYYRRRAQDARFAAGPPPEPDDGPEDGENELPDVGPDQLLEIELRVAEAELAALIRRCLTRPQGGRLQAEVLIRRGLLQHSVPEVAEALRIPPGRVSLEFHRARKGLLKYCTEVIDLLIQHLAPSQRQVDRKGDT